MPVAHAIFTQKFRIAGDPYASIWEMPTFGHSNNHVGLQVADLLASALLFPIAAFAYCTGHITNGTHVKAGYSILRERYGERLRHLQFRYQDQGQRWRGGITVSDAHAHRNGAHLFTDLSAVVGAAPAAGTVVAAPTTPSIVSTPISNVPPPTTVANPQSP